MPRRWLHYLEQDGLRVFLARGGRLHLQQRFAASADEVARFGRWLRHTPHAGEHELLVDLPDEAFHLDSVPWVRGRDRRAMLQRRLGQHFFATPYTTVLSLGRASEGRRDETLLYTALTQPAAVAPWLAAMRDQPLALRALRTPSLLLPRLLAAVAPPAGEGLLLALSPTGIRQSYFVAGRLRFSRLSPAPEGACARWGTDCLREVRKTCQYLVAQRWLARGRPLTVSVLLHEADRAPFLAALTDDDSLRWQAVDLVRLGQRFGLQPHSSDCRPLFMQLALAEREGPQLAPPADRRFHHLWRLQRAALAVGAASCLVAAMFAVGLREDSATHRRETLRALAQRALDDAQAQRIQQSLPTPPAPPRQLATLIENHRRLLAARHEPQPALQRLSEVLDGFPDLQLQRLEWHGAAAEADLLAAPASQRIELTATWTGAGASEPQVLLARGEALARALQDRGGGQVRVNRQDATDVARVLHSEATSDAATLDLQWQWRGALP